MNYVLVNILFIQNNQNFYIFLIKYLMNFDHSYIDYKKAFDSVVWLGWGHMVWQNCTGYWVVVLMVLANYLMVFRLGTPEIIMTQDIIIYY